MKQDFAKLLTLLNLNFQDPDLLNQAFIHRSYLNEVRSGLSSNERLEFLGDAVLSLVITNYLYGQRGKDTEGDLTNLRAFIVKTKSLSEAAKRLDLGSYLKLSRGEMQSGGGKNPQLLANTYEALLGAIFLDLGLDEAQKVIMQTLIPLFESEIKMGPPKDAKSELQEFVQEQLKKSPIYKILTTRGPDHAKQFIIAVYVGGKEYGKGAGNSKQIAEEQAAHEALEKLNK